MVVGIWFAYCSREKLIQLDKLARQLARHSELVLHRDQENLLVVTVHDSRTGDDADITVNIDTGAHVILEAAELAEEGLPVDPGVPVPDVEALGIANARYEITWELKFSDEVYNPLIFIAEILIQACDAIVFDVTNYRFV